MPGQPAARIGDLIACPVPQATPAALPHAAPGLPVMPPGAATVLVGGQPAARVGDQSLCVAPVPTPNLIVRGAFPVPIRTQAAARMTDQATHPGSMIIPPCCPTVLIGLAGTSGNPWAANAQCQNMSAGRTPPPGSTDRNGNPLQANTAGQSYNNCGVESARQIISQGTGSNISQEGLLNQVIANGQASQPAVGAVVNGTAVTPTNQAWHSGGTNTTSIASILTNNGAPATTTTVAPGGAPTLGSVEAAVSSGRGVVAPLNVQGLPGWGTQAGGHAVVVTGFEYDDNGNITRVIYNDTGIGVCQQTATPAQFQNSMNLLAAQQTANGQTPMGFAVTNAPVW